VPKQATGCDYSWDRPDLSCLHGKGVRFVCRYGSGDPSKDLSKPELDAILSRGMSVCVVYQYSKTQMAGGYPAGQADARRADSFVAGLGGRVRRRHVLQADVRHRPDHVRVADVRLV